MYNKEILFPGHGIRILGTLKKRHRIQTKQKPFGKMCSPMVDMLSLSKTAVLFGYLFCDN